MIRVILPPQLRALAQTDDEVQLALGAPLSQRGLLEALEARYPVLRGTLRDPVTQQRRPRVRFYAGQDDISLAPPDELLPDAVLSGREPLLVVAAISGG